MNLKTRNYIVCLVVVALATVSASLMAASSLPWESPLNNLAASLTGPTAKAIALIGLFVAGGLLVFGGELSDFGRRVTWMCLAISVMIAGSSFLSLVGSGGSTGAALVLNTPLINIMHV